MLQDTCWMTPAKSAAVFQRLVLLPVQPVWINWAGPFDQRESRGRGTRAGPIQADAGKGFQSRLGTGRATGRATRPRSLHVI